MLDLYFRVENRGGSRISQSEGALTPEGTEPIIWHIVCRKLHENEKNGLRVGGRLRQSRSPS